MVVWRYRQGRAARMPCAIQLELGVCTRSWGCLLLSHSVRRRKHSAVSYSARLLAIGGEMSQRHFKATTVCILSLPNTAHTKAYQHLIEIRLGRDKVKPDLLDQFQKPTPSITQHTTKRQAGAGSKQRIQLLDLPQLCLDWCPPLWPSILCRRQTVACTYPALMEHILTEERGIFSSLSEKADK